MEVEVKTPTEKTYLKNYLALSIAFEIMFAASMTGAQQLEEILVTT